MGRDSDETEIAASDLPEVLRARDFAALLHITPAALRQRVRRRQVPPPFRSGRALAWTRESVLSWLRDCGRSAGTADMKITLRPYPKDRTRWHVDIRLMDPCNPKREIRKRKVAPAGMSEAQARTWGERQVPTIIRAALQGEADDNGRKRTTTRSSPPSTELRALGEAAPNSPWRSSTSSASSRSTFASSSRLRKLATTRRSATTSVRCRSHASFESRALRTLSSFAQSTGLEQNPSKPASRHTLLAGSSSTPTEAELVGAGMGDAFGSAGPAATARSGRSSRSATQQPRRRRRLSAASR